MTQTSPISRLSSGQTLLLDADDTLWENNIYFERAIAAFISCLDHHEYSPDEVRLKLNEVERETILTHGYGVSSFRQSLIACFERLSHSENHFTASKRELVAGFAQSIIDQEIELLPGVAETLPELASRHRLILVTKGNHAEQADKFQRSSLQAYFTAVEIPPEKNPAAYHAIVAKYELAPHTTWMIGNSPKSDINPALAAGLHAILIHHPSTWVLEREHVNSPPAGQNFLELTAFDTLSEYF
jgi:putative hydrolase of the HAD superfamily